MLALNAMVHKPHGFSASMIATGREPTLPPDLENDACASPSLNDPTYYVKVLSQRISLTHQQMTPPPAPAATNPYQEGSLIFVLTTPPERTNKLAPRWKGPFRVKMVPNPYQVVYEDGSAWCTIHANQAKPATFTTLQRLHPHLSLPDQLLDTSLGAYKDLALVSLLLLFNQPHLPGAPLLFPQPQYPRCLPPRLPRARSRPAGLSQPIGIPLVAPLPRQTRGLPLPREPMRIQDPALDRGTLPG